jgi:hypothetical protein
VAEETVVKEQLAPWAIGAGLDLTRRLLRSSFELVASFWLYSSDANSWRLVIASPRLQSEGILQAYERVRQILLSSGQHVDEWADYHIDLVRPELRLIQAMRSLGEFEIPELPPEPTGRMADPKRIRLMSIDGMFIEDAYVYYLTELSRRR